MRRSSIRNILIVTALGLALALTLSRSAWIAAAVITVVALVRFFPRGVGMKLAVYVGVPAIFLLTLLTFFYPQIILRAASSQDHLDRPIAALQRMVEHPFGAGLGAAGPASNRVSDACVHLPENADASWAADRPELCVFAGDEQVQPADRACNCPFLPENWYLQIGVELGWLGFVLFVALIVFSLLRLRKERHQALTEGLFLAVLGVSVAAVALHAWEDSAVAYTAWMLLAATRRMRFET
jgi:O-antigen ligase